jgi:hypothetical protein
MKVQGQVMGIIGQRVATTDVYAANDFVRNARRKIEEKEDGDEIASAFAGGLEFMIENLKNHLQVSRGKVISAKGFDNDALDRVYRYALVGAEKAAAMLKVSSATVQYKGLKMSFGCLAISHLYRLRFMETQVPGGKLEAVQNATKNVECLILDLLAISIPEPKT